MKKIQFCDNKNIIYNQLKARRKEKRLSQADLAARMQTLNVNMDQQMISRIERNQRIVTDYELACLCVILEVEAKDLLGENIYPYIQ
jgi:transcriptional regulator with XRE-family HTH domain